jgi:molecular chaperone GrpE
MTEQDKQQPTKAPSAPVGEAEPKTAEEWRKVAETERARAEGNLTGWQRAQADFQNYKRRVEQERTELLRQATAPALAQVLTVLDDLERAFTALPHTLMHLTWVEGIALIHRKLLGILDSQGVREIDALGKPFDPQLHEAIAEGEGPEGQVVHVIQKGYYLHDRVLRPALVQVGRGGRAASGQAGGEASLGGDAADRQGA